MLVSPAPADAYDMIGCTLRRKDSPVEYLRLELAQPSRGGDHQLNMLDGFGETEFTESDPESSRLYWQGAITFGITEG